MSKYKWHGEAVKTEFGYMKVTENKDRPLYWYNYECNWDYDQNRPRYSVGDKRALIPAIRITTGEGQTFCIANHFGVGVHKLVNGGWPGHRHFSFADGCEFVSNLCAEERHLWDIREFDLESFEEYESSRIKWQKKTYPEESERSEHLRRLILGSK